ncbi:WG repeat-containing protein [Flavobacterium kingsejongi]|uniref:WG repeat-containing protein n=1 Tax=Flavobacterium kingsejongi TaxID=1678728 RepID=A0A2S1LQM7_9FLAO|nr:WG repeat-containing protein [Flavobacterium kingsejongi]AWG26044.1 hypothetical protein FK004_12825 [Flavobacterium kingsejongi]
MKKNAIWVLFLLLNLTACSQKNENTKSNAEKGNVKELIEGEHHDNQNYYIFKKNQKFGICDGVGNIIIPAQFDEFGQRNDNYYVEQKNGNYILYWLDVKNKKLVSLPQFADFHFNISDNIDVFTDENQKFGVYKNRKEVLLPFSYFKMNKFGNTILGRKEGLKVVDAFDTKLVPKSGIDFSDFRLLSEKEQLVAVEKEGKWGVVNYDLKQVVPYRYSNINELQSHGGYFIVSQKENNKNLFGIIDVKGKVIVALNYCDIEEEGTRIKFCKNDKYSIVAFEEFIK